MNPRIKVLEREAASAALNPLIPASVRAALAEAVAFMRETDARLEALERAQREYGEAIHDLERSAR
jgi:hypothetical protein